MRACTYKTEKLRWVGEYIAINKMDDFTTRFVTQQQQQEQEIEEEEDKSSFFMMVKAHSIQYNNTGTYSKQNRALFTNSLDVGHTRQEGAVYIYASKTGKYSQGSKGQCICARYSHLVTSTILPLGRIVRLTMGVLGVTIISMHLHLR